MAMMAGKLYIALKAANVSEDDARAAAEESAITTFDFEKIRGEFSLVKWMMGTIIALQLGTIGTIVGFAINHATFR